MNNSIIALRNKYIRHRTFFQNFSYISILHFFNLFIPLFTYPYLIRVLGNETYGLVVFAQATIGYLVILVGFGFNISATRNISINRNDKTKLNEIVSSIFIIKGGFFLIAFIILLVSFLFLKQACDNKVLFFLTFHLCLLDWLFPLWYFQGIEKMKYITYLNVTSKVLFLFFTFLFIKSSDDFLFVPLFNGIGTLIICLTSLYIIFKKHKVSFTFPKYNIIRNQLFESFPIFTSNISLQLYLGTNKVIIGLLLGMHEVSYYDLGEKLLNLIKIPILAVSQVLFPKLANDFNRNFLLKVGFFATIFTLIIILSILFFTNNIIDFIAGKNMIGAITTVRILIVAALPLVLSNIFGVQTLLAKGYNKPFFVIVFLSLCFYIIYIFLCYSLNVLNLMTISSSYLFVEIFMLMLFIRFVSKNKLLSNN